MFTEGERIKGCYVIYEGEYEVTVKMGTKDFVISRVGPYEVMGLEDLLLKKGKCSHTLTCISPKGSLRFIPERWVLTCKSSGMMKSVT